MARVFDDAWVVVPQVAAMRETVFGVRTHYVRAGQGEPLIMIHGGGPGSGGAAGWAHTIPALSQRYEVFAIDLIDSGWTDKPRIDYSFQTLVNHVGGVSSMRSASTKCASWATPRAPMLPSSTCWTTLLG